MIVNAVRARQETRSAEVTGPHGLLFEENETKLGGRKQRNWLMSRTWAQRIAGQVVQSLSSSCAQKGRQYPETWSQIQILTSNNPEIQTHIIRTSRVRNPKRSETELKQREKLTEIRQVWDREGNLENRPRSNTKIEINLKSWHFEEQQFKRWSSLGWTSGKWAPSPGKTN